MATELGKAYVQIAPSARGIKGAIEKELGGEANEAGKSAGASIAGAIKKAIVAAGIGKVLKESLLEGAALQQSIGGVETLFKGAAETVKKNADIAFSSAGVSANEYMEIVTGFAASLLQGTAGDTERAAKIADTAMIDMADNANKMGTDMQSIQNAYQGFAKQNYTMLDNLKLGYGGTKTEMERLLADAEKFSGVKYDISNLADVYEAIHVIQEELDIAGTTAKEAEETFSGSFASMKAAAKNLLGNLSLGADIIPSLQAMGKTIKTFIIGNLIPMLKNIISGIPVILQSVVREAAQALVGFMSSLPELLTAGVEFAKKIGAGLIEGIPQAIQAANRMRSDIIDVILGALPQVIDAGMSIAEGLGQAFTEGLPLMVSSLSDNFKTILAWLRENSGEFLERGKELIKSVADGILENAPSMITALGGVITEAAGWILDELPKFLEHGAELIAHLAKGIANALPNILSAIGTVIKGLLSKLTDGETLRKIFNAGVTLLKEIVKGILSLIGGAGSYLWNNAGKIVETIINAIKNLFRNLVTIGGDIIKQIWEGIKNLITGAGSWLWNNAKKIPEHIIDAIKAVATAIIGVGGWILKTIWEGISGLFSWLFEKAKSIVSWIIDGAKAVGGSVVGLGKWIITSVWDGISSLGSWLYEKAKGLVSWIIDGIKSVGSWLWDAGSWVVGKVTDAIYSDVANDRCVAAGAAMGGDIALGIKTETNKGLSNIISNVRSALNQIANMPEARKAGAAVGSAMVNGTKQTLLISSPSKVYEDEIGKMLPPGAAQGVLRNMKPFTDAMEAMADKGMAAFEADFRPDMRFVNQDRSTAAEAILSLLLRYLPELAEHGQVDAAGMYAAFNRQMGMAIS